MKQNQNARKQRGRSAPRKGGKNNSGGNRGNEPKVRGNPKQLLEKYKNQAREAKQAGDRVQAEYYYQFADHYQRIVNEIAERQGGNNRVENAQADEEAQSGQDGAKQQRRGRGRRPRNGESPEAEAPKEAVSDAENVPQDLAEADQPVEVHPELDLNGTEAEEKPKRRRAPVQRRRSPRAKADAEAPQQEAGSAGDTSPEGNEAA